MANYKHIDTSNAMNKIREMFALARELAPQIDRCKQRYSPELANQKIMEFHQQYRAANQEARNAVKAAIGAARQRVENARSEMLRIGNAEEDFKVLALPVTLSRDELRAMVKRNEGNVLFARAVAQYAKEHNYDDRDFLALVLPPSFDAQIRDIEHAGMRLMRYCEEDNLDVVLSNGGRARSFGAAERMGDFENL